MASAQSLACGEPPPAGGKAGRRGPPGGATRSSAGTSTCARTAAGTARHRLKGAGAKAVGQGRPTAPETRDGARQKDVAVRTAGHPTPQRTRRGTARHTAETRQMDDNRRAVKLPRFEKTPNPRDQGPTRARENEAEGKGAGGAPRPPGDRRRGGARRRPAAGELARRKAPGAARGCRPRWTSGGPQHLTICTITRIVLDTWPLPGARDWGRRRAEGPPCPGRWRTRGRRLSRHGPRGAGQCPSPS